MSNVAKTKACPRWAVSYGVCPHTESFTSSLRATKVSICWLKLLKSCIELHLISYSSGTDGVSELSDNYLPSRRDSICQALREFPRRSCWSILYDNAESLIQFFADAVGFLPVSGLTGLCTGINKGLDLGTSGVINAAVPIQGRIESNAKNARQLIEHSQPGTCQFALLSLLAWHWFAGDVVEAPHERIDDCHASRRVEVIVHGSNELLAIVGELFGFPFQRRSVAYESGSRLPRFDPTMPALDSRTYLLGKIGERRAVGLRQQIQAQGRSRCHLQRRLDGHEDAGMGHFLLPHVQQTGMDPVACKWFAGEALTLGDLVLVVREDQIGTAAMDIDLFPQRFHCHRRTLDMPTRTSITPAPIPPRLPRFPFFPAGKVTRLTLPLA